MSFKTYINELQKTLKSGQATEPSYYPSLKSLLENLSPGVSVLVNPKKTQHGSPDFNLKRKGSVLEFPVGWIEAKEIGEDLNKVEKSEQLKRYLHLPNLILTDFLEFRWYTDGQHRLTASLGAVQKRKLQVSPGGESGVHEILLAFLKHKTPPTRDSRELAKRMAGLAHLIRDAILTAYESEGVKAKLHKQLQAFREALIPDLGPEQFADMYAQTIAYGLFAARCQPSQGNEKFTRERAAYLIPKTNPFLRKLFNEIAGPDLPEDIQPDVDDLVALLRETDIGSVLDDFGKRTAKEDPVVHFYEDFLQAYDPKLREMRGVYYTPVPVVSYIVRSVDHLLKTKFGKPMGLADKQVLILDPACGTGTFLYYVIRHIYATLMRQGQKGQWNSYVSENLIKRVFGFELLMAPYAVAHLKVGLLLKELGYKFESDERLGIYLTNTLDEAIKRSEIVFAQWIADEGSAAAAVKKEEPIMVVLGNPPYSGISANRGEWITHLVEDYRKVDGKPLGEKKVWLADDYVKFIRFGQWRIDRTGQGVVCFISNHGYLDNPTFRGMRQSLRKSFSTIHVLDLHGSSKKKQKAPTGGADQNVFDIQQGVAIGTFLKSNNDQSPASVFHSEIWGTREAKYKFLDDADIQSTDWRGVPSAPPDYLFIPRSEEYKKEYQAGWKVTDIFPTYSSGILTARDGFVVALDEQTLRTRIERFRDKKLADGEVKNELGLSENYAWRISEARAQLIAEKNWRENFAKVLYRPFDVRDIYNHPSVVWRPRTEIMRQMQESNLALATTRSTEIGSFEHVLCSRWPLDHHSVSLKEVNYMFPLYIYPDGSAQQGSLMSTTQRRPNIAEGFVTALIGQLQLEWRADERGDLKETVGPEDIFAYIYSILWAPSFRKRYVEFLKSDFPRIPLTSDRDLFARLTKRGLELVALHLLESPTLSRVITRYQQPGNHLVEKVRYVEANPKVGIKVGRVHINAQQYFEGVPKEVWEFHIGGYQVCEKWLKDRKGRKLSSDDIDHYQKIVVALHETIRVMREIDALIPGWPLA
jgi:hypothetical protein